jgi:hypothetical protein
LHCTFGDISDLTFAGIGDLSHVLLDLNTLLYVGQVFHPLSILNLELLCEFFIDFAGAIRVLSYAVLLSLHYVELFLEKL